MSGSIVKNSGGNHVVDLTKGTLEPTGLAKEKHFETIEGGGGGGASINPKGRSVIYVGRKN